MAIRFSIITIVRNNRSFIGDAIRSVISQSYPHVEYVVIDGASTDGTVDVIRSHEEGIDKWVSERDNGIADAFNKGLALATGDYILFLNSDDALAGPDVLQAIAGKIVESDYPALFYGDYDILDRESGEFKYHGRVNFSPRGLIHGQILPHPCLFTHRAYFDKYGNFDNDFRIAMDYEWLLRGGLAERVVHLPMLVTNIRDGGISTFDKRRVVDEIIQAQKKNKLIRSALGEYRLRGYFLGRTFARKVLSAVGLYKMFASLRNKLKQPASS
jgi:glycosyltransferase involved in cell wall biosynthesis